MSCSSCTGSNHFICDHRIMVREKYPQISLAFWRIFSEITLKGAVQQYRPTGSTYPSSKESLFVSGYILPIHFFLKKANTTNTTNRPVARILPLGKHHHPKGQTGSSASGISHYWGGSCHNWGSTPPKCTPVAMGLTTKCCTFPVLSPPKGTAPSKNRVQLHSIINHKSEKCPVLWKRYKKKGIWKGHHELATAQECSVI